MKDSKKIYSIKGTAIFSGIVLFIGLTMGGGSVLEIILATLLAGALGWILWGEKWEILRRLEKGEE